MDTQKNFVATLYPRKNRLLTRTWYVEYTINGGKPLRKYGNLNKLFTVEEREEEANRLKRIIEEEAQDPIKAARAAIASKSVRKRRLLGFLWEAFEEHTSTNRSKTKASYKSKVWHFQDWFFTSEFTEFSTEALNAYCNFLSTEIVTKNNKERKPKKRSNKTVNDYKGYLHTFFEAMIQKGTLDKNPLHKYRRAESKSASWHYFDEEAQRELKQVISTKDPQLWLACQLQYYCLIRPKEMRELKIEDINIREGSISVHSWVAKNKVTYHVRIPDVFLDSLRFIKEYPRDYYLLGKEGVPGPERVSQNGLSDRHRAILIELDFNINKYKFYSWKHSGAVFYYKKTKDLKGLKEQGRWSSLDMVEEYLKNLIALDIPSIKKDYPPIGGKIAEATLGTPQDTAAA